MHVDFQPAVIQQDIIQQINSGDTAGAIQTYTEALENHRLDQATINFLSQTYDYLPFQDLSAAPAHGHAELDPVPDGANRGQSFDSMDAATGSVQGSPSFDSTHAASGSVQGSPDFRPLDAEARSIPDSPVSRETAASSAGPTPSVAPSLATDATLESLALSRVDSEVGAANYDSGSEFDRQAAHLRGDGAVADIARVDRFVEEQEAAAGGDFV
ncbi:hypothetical protein [Pleionea sp. CnH1-48]|uniref:hypothetical protein n=1 Tax=Pleionea sp. CnH1-48 TaxID=2954494 RepID=UPI002096A646|nr:hypothetical protein [Pleionea sp. CnH1-48]MCO7227006.1 hypothetical protein [Pleionea sp. CnH1-48]